jgi:hypothetical protein
MTFESSGLTTPNDEDHDADLPNAVQTQQGEGKQRDGEEWGEDEDWSEREDEEERKMVTQGAAALSTRNRKAGTIRRAGVMEHVELHNFMCHELLSFDLGPQINFVIGNNGSGKSAILTAITLALGGKASSTVRRLVLPSSLATTTHVARGSESWLQS